jgi:hypothetical protein
LGGVRKNLIERYSNHACPTRFFADDNQHPELEIVRAALNQVSGPVMQTNA